MRLLDWMPAAPIIDRKASQRKAELEELASFILYLLWDLGLKIGHSVRNVNEALKEAREDITIRTNVLESRYIAGDKRPANEFTRRFQQEIVAHSQKEFVQAKLEEWRGRHEKLGASRYVLEPNVKEGKGGLRDLHTLIWLTNYCFGVTKMRDLHKLGRISKEELADFRRCRSFLYLVRLHLHDLTNRPDERLTFDAQRAIAERIGYRAQTVNQAVERFMKRYFLTTKTIGSLTRNLYFMLLEEYQPGASSALRVAGPALPEGFCLESGRLHFTDTEWIAAHPAKIIELFWLSHDRQCEIHPASWQWVTRHLRLIDRSVQQDAEANRLFVAMLTDTRNSEAGLRRMNESGVLGKFIPDFGRVIGQMQFDLYHTYTVDEHTIFALGILHRIELGELADVFPLATKVSQHIHLRRALYLGLLCHDIAKGRGGDHSHLGEEIARKLGKRFGFSATEMDTAAWLVKEHLLFAMTAFKRNLDDPLTIEHFADKVQSLQRLRLLVVLTVADIRAVGPTIWNSWKGTLLRDLYYKAERELGESEDSPLLSTHLQYRLREELAGLSPQTPAEILEQYLEEAEPGFLEAYSADLHALFLPQWHKVTTGELPVAIHFNSNEQKSITEITVVAPDHKGLFASIAGVIAVTGATILHARITTRKDGIVIDRFGIQDMEGKAFSERRRQDRIAERLRQVLVGTLALQSELDDAEKRYPAVPASFKNDPVVFIDNRASARFSVIEMQCLDRRGLLYEIAHCLTQLGVNIASAHISTYGEVANDVFYVKDSYGLKIDSPIRQQQIIDALMQVMKRRNLTAKRKGET
jgi:[protein-PII] uridylyltransferase